MSADEALRPTTDPIDNCEKCGCALNGEAALIEELDEVWCHSCADNTAEADIDPGSLARHLRGLAARLQYRVECIEARDGKDDAVTGRGIGIGYLLARDLSEALSKAAAFIESRGY